MAAIESDIDGTAFPTFRETMRLLRTEADTLMGPGLGLDIVNSFWTHGPHPDGAIEHRIAYLGVGEDPGARPYYAEELAAYIRAGWAETLHCYGRIAAPFTRDAAMQALDRLEGVGARPGIWTNHGRNNPQSILGDAPGNAAFEGDRPDAAGYHADLLRAFGVKYFWTGAFGHVTGGTRRPARPMRLQDGAQVWAFDRATAMRIDAGCIDYLNRNGAFPMIRAGVASASLAQPAQLEAMLAPERLQALADAGEFCIFAQHLGNVGGSLALPPSAVAALRGLKGFHDRGVVLVAATRRLLDYSIARDGLRFDWTVAAGVGRLNLTAIADPVTGPRTPTTDEVAGLSFAFTPEGEAWPTAISVALDGVALPADRLFFEQGERSLIFGVRWPKADVADHAASFAAKPARTRPAMAQAFDHASAVAALARPTGRALKLVHDPSGRWRAALLMAGHAAVDLLDADADRDVGGVIVTSPSDKPAAAVLADLRSVAPPIVPRIFHVETVDAVLATLAAGDRPLTPADIAPLWADELRRLAPLRMADGPFRFRDRADFARALVWSGYQSFGETDWAGGARLTAAAGQVVLALARPYPRDPEQFFRAVRGVRFRAAPYEQLDWIAETLGFAAALEIIDAQPADWLSGPRRRVREILFNAASDARANRRATPLRGLWAAADRLLAARRFASVGAWADALAIARRIATPEARMLAAMAEVAAGQYDEAVPQFQAAPAGSQRALIGLLFASLQAGVTVDHRAAIAAYFAALEKADSAERAHIGQVAVTPTPSAARAMVCHLLGRG